MIPLVSNVSSINNSIITYISHMLQWISSVLHAQITQVVTEIYTVSTELVNVQEMTIGHQPCVLQVSFVIYYCIKSTASVVLWLACQPLVRQIVGWNPVGSNQRLCNWYLLLLRKAHTIKEQEQNWLASNQINVSELGMTCLAL